MITCKLGGKEYTIDFVSARALREIGPAEAMYEKVMAITQAHMEGREAPEAGLTVAEALDVMVRWFCIVFRNQFTPEEVYDGYPIDRLTHDIAYAMLAVKNQMTGVLSEFPTRPAAKEAERA